MKKSIVCILLAILFTIGSFPCGISEDNTVYAASNEEIIYKYLKEEMGLNTAAACGVLANIYKESSFNPNALEYGYTWSSGGGYGICQWTNYPRTSSKGRRTNLVNYCKQNGYDYKTLEGQLHYLQYELETSYKTKVLDRLLAVPDTAEGAFTAGYVWCYYFERPAGYKTGTSDKRGDLAKSRFWPKYKDDALVDICQCLTDNAGEYICTSSDSTIPIRSGHSASHPVTGEIDSGATVIVSAAGENWAHVTYNGISGYISMENLAMVEDYAIDENYITPFYAKSLPESGIDVYNRIHGALKYTASDMEIIVPEVYTNGWCMVICIRENEDGTLSAERGYTVLSSLMDAEYSIEAFTLADNTDVYADSEGEKYIDTVKGGTVVYIIGSTEGAMHILYPAGDDGYYFAWIKPEKAPVVTASHTFVSLETGTDEYEDVTFVVNCDGEFTFSFAEFEETYISGELTDNGDGTYTFRIIPRSTGIVTLTYIVYDTSADMLLHEGYLKVIVTEKGVYKKGDVNADGFVNALDATQILRYANNKSSVLGGMDDVEKIKRADVNSDGLVNALDATQILRFANNKPSALSK